MAIGKMIVWFYCLRISESVLLLLGSTFIFFWLERKMAHYHWWQWFVAGLLFTLLVAIYYTTIGNRSESGDFRISLIPFHSYQEALTRNNPELYRSNFMNAALFYPAGLLATALLPKRWPGWCKCILVTILLMAMSVGVEYAQYYYALGDCEIDDVIHNTAGALVGSLAAMILPPVLTFGKEKILQRYHQWHNSIM